MMRLCLAAALLVTASPALAATHDYDDLPSDLAHAVEAYDAAQLHNDGAALGRLLADDYRLAGSSGKVETKAAFIADSTDPNFRLLPFTLRDPVHIVWGDGAVLSAVVDNHWIDHGKPGGETMRFADIWAKRGGRWQVVYTQVTRLPDGFK